VILDEKDRRIAELEAIVARQQELIEKLEKRIADLEERLNRSSRNSSKPPSSDPPWAKPKSRLPDGQKRSPGGQPGHEKHERPLVPPSKVSEFVVVKPTHCGHCGLPLVGNDPDPERHQVFELPKIEPRVTEYQIHTLPCACGAQTRGELPAGVPHKTFGPNLTALVCWLSGKFRLSKRAIVELLADLLGTEVSLGAVCNMEREASEALAAPVAEARAYVKTQPVAHMDETGWRECNRKAWLWVVVTPLVAVFAVARSRGANIAKYLLGKKFAGVLGTDRWSAYAFVDDTRRQLCWAHLIRDFRAMVDRCGPSRRIGDSLLALVDQFFVWWHKVHDGEMPRETFEHNMAPVIDQVDALLRAGTRCANRKTAGTCAHILDLEWALWTFVFADGVEPTNNVAERTLRPAVMWRKTSFGTQSKAGSRFVERILTATASLRLQDRHVLSYLSSAIAARRHNEPAPSILPKTTSCTAAAA
jgi:transposase